MQAIVAGAEADTWLKIIGAIAGAALSAGTAAALVNYLLGKRKANVDDKDIIITGAERIVLAGDHVIEQLREQMGALYQQNLECERANRELRILNEGLTARVVTLERTVARLERQT